MKHNNYFEKPCNIIIPERINNIKITAIGLKAFYEQSNIVSLSIPSTVVVIDSYAFSNCENLKTIDIPNAVTFMGEKAFMDCVRLTSVMLPPFLNIIRGSLFFNCRSLKSVYLSENTKTIHSSAFAYCDSLELITLPKEIKTIDSVAFYKCKSLSNFEIPDEIENISPTAFSECNNLFLIYLGSKASLNSLISEKHIEKYKRDNIKILAIKDIDECIDNNHFDRLVNLIENDTEQKYAINKISNIIPTTIDLNKKLKLLSIYNNIKKRIILE